MRFFFNRLASPIPGRGICPYLGMAEDPQTCLAYPSEWNLCQRARPVASVKLEHQRTTCLLPDHAACMVYQSEAPIRLPASLRKSQSSSARLRRQTWLFVVMVLIGFGLWGAWRSSPGLALLVPVTPTSFKPEQPASTKVSDPVTIAPSPVPTVRSTLSQETLLPPAPTTVPVITSTPVKNCGYELEDRIELGQHTLIMHQVVYGESLDMLALNYDTSVQAIQALNYYLPSPIWTDVVAVIPVGSADVGDLPVFEPVLVTEPVISLGLLAQQLSATEEDLAYNTLDTNCPSYSGWILVPHLARKNP